MYPIFPSQPTLLPMFDVPLPTLYRRFHLKITLAESLWRLYRRRRFNPVASFLYALTAHIFQWQT
jgi:hypothetical protein